MEEFLKIEQPEVWSLVLGLGRWAQVAQAFGLMSRLMVPGCMEIARGIAHWATVHGPTSPPHRYRVVATESGMELIRRAAIVSGIPGTQAVVMVQGHQVQEGDIVHPDDPVRMVGLMRGGGPREPGPSEEEEENFAGAHQTAGASSASCHQIDPQSEGEQASGSGGPLFGTEWPVSTVDRAPSPVIASPGMRRHLAWALNREVIGDATGAGRGGRHVAVVQSAVTGDKTELHLTGVEPAAWPAYLTKFIVLFMNAPSERHLRFVTQEQEERLPLEEWEKTRQLYEVILVQNPGEEDDDELCASILGAIPSGGAEEDRVYPTNRPVWSAEAVSSGRRR